MYAHKVINDGVKFLYNLINKEVTLDFGLPEEYFLENLPFLLDEIKNCQKFYCPSFGSIFNMFMGKDTVNVELEEWIDKTSSEFIRPPYPVFWLDYTYNYGDVSSTTNTKARHKGILVHEYFDKNMRMGFLHVAVFSRITVGGEWSLLPVRHVVITGRKPESKEELEFLEKSHKLPMTVMFGGALDRRVFSYSPNSNELDQQYIKAVFEASTLDLIMLHSFILMLCTKGSKFRIHKPPKALGMKKKKKKKLSRFTYKTLEIHLSDGSVINMDGRKGSNLCDSKGVHVCRLAIKSYGMEPGQGLLFGKYRRIIIVPSHMRGKAKHGAVRKEYVIKD